MSHGPLIVQVQGQVQMHAMVPRFFANWDVDACMGVKSKADAIKGYKLVRFCLEKKYVQYNGKQGYGLPEPLAASGHGLGRCAWLAT